MVPPTVPILVILFCFPFVLCEGRGLGVVGPIKVLQSLRPNPRWLQESFRVEPRCLLRSLSGQKHRGIAHPMAPCAWLWGP